MMQSNRTCIFIALSDVWSVRFPSRRVAMHQQKCRASPEHLVSARLVVTSLCFHSGKRTDWCHWASQSLCRRWRWTLWIKDEQCMESAGTKRLERWRSFAQTCSSLCKVLASCKRASAAPFLPSHVVIRDTHRKWAACCQEAIKSQREVTTWIILSYSDTQTILQIMLQHN